MKALKITFPSYQEEGEHYKWLLFIIALLINLFILFLIFIITVDHDFFMPTKREADAPVVFEQPPAPAAQPPPPPEPPKSDEVAALKPGASNFGMADEMQDDFVAHAQQAAQEVEQPEDPPQEIVEEEHINPIKKEEPQQKTTQPTTAALQALEKVYNDPQSLVKKQIPQQETAQKVAKPKPIEQQKPEIIKAPIKKDLSFQDMAKGFLASLDEGGHDLMERKGNENIRPDFEEMRILCYLQKIIWFMQQEWLRSNDLRNTPVACMVITGVSITIDKSGTLKHASVVQSSGNNILDSALIKGIKDASPYPSLPAHFKEKDFTAQFGIKHGPHSGQQHNRPYFGMR